MPWIVPSTVSLSPNSSFSRSDIASFLSSLVPGQSISSASIYRISVKLGFEGKSIPLHQVGHFYLAIVLRELWNYHAYEKLIEFTKINSETSGDSRTLNQHWSDVEKVGGLSKVDFESKLMTTYSLKFSNRLK